MTRVTEEVYDQVRHQAWRWDQVRDQVWDQVLNHALIQQEVEHVSLKTVDNTA